MTTNHKTTRIPSWQLSKEDKQKINNQFVQKGLDVKQEIQKENERE